MIKTRSALDDLKNYDKATLESIIERAKYLLENHADNLKAFRENPKYKEIMNECMELEKKIKDMNMEFLTSIPIRFKISLDSDEILWGSPVNNHYKIEYKADGGFDVQEFAARGVESICFYEKYRILNLVREQNKGFDSQMQYIYDESQRLKILFDNLCEQFNVKVHLIEELEWFKNSQK